MSVSIGDDMVFLTMTNDRGMKPILLRWNGVDLFFGGQTRRTPSPLRYTILRMIRTVGQLRIILYWKKTQKVSVTPPDCLFTPAYPHTSRAAKPQRTGRSSSFGFPFQRRFLPWPPHNRSVSILTLKLD